MWELCVACAQVHYMAALARCCMDVRACECVACVVHLPPPDCQPLFLHFWFVCERPEVAACLQGIASVAQSARPIGLRDGQCAKLAPYNRPF